MSKKWEDKGVVPNLYHDIPNLILPKSLCTDTHKVVDKETNKERFLRVEGNQTVGEAIAKGQWED